MSLPLGVRPIEALDIGRHVCAVFDNDADRDAAFAAFFTAGCQRGEKLLFISDGTPGDGVLARLDGQGCPARELAASGRWRTLDASETYLRVNPFGSDHMISLMQQEIDQALAEGYPALRVIGEMTWALRGEPNPLSLMDYEVRLNRFTNRTPWIGLCAYDLRRFPADLMLEVIDAHPEVALGDEIYPNDFYFPAEEYGAADRPAATLRFRLEALAGRARRLAALSESEEMLADAVSALPDAVVVFDAQLDYRFWNTAAEDLFMPPNGVHDPHEVLPRPGDGVSDEPLARALAGERVVRTGVPRPSPGGEIIVDEWWTPMQQRLNRPRGVVLVARPAHPQAGD